jgi:hypothetical protein
MQIRTDWTLTLSEEEYLCAQPESFRQLLDNPGLQRAFREALGEAQAVVEPRAGWERFPIREIRHDRLVVADGVKIGGGPVVPVVGGASELVVAVCTIGARADELVTAAQKAREYFKAMVLHEMTSWAVGLLRQELCRYLDHTLRAEGLNVSAALSPGESVWSVKDQAIIFELLDAGKIGVTLTPSMMMRPRASLSLIMGAGRDRVGVADASNCDFCTMRDRCRYRHHIAVEATAPAAG